MLMRTSNRRNVSFVERWSNRTAFLVGFLTGRGYSAPQIAGVLDDGTLPGTVTKMWGHWHVNGVRPTDEVAIMVPLTDMQRSALGKRAAQHGLSMEEFARRILTCATMPSDLYDAIVPDGQFEDVT